MVKVNTERLVAEAAVIHKPEIEYAGQKLEGRALSVPLLLGRHRGRPSKQPRDFLSRQRQHVRFLRRIIEGTKRADFFEPPHGVEGVEEPGVARGQLSCFKITTPQIQGAKRARIFGGEQMETEPAPVGARNLLGFPEERDEQKQ